MTEKEWLGDAVCCGSEVLGKPAQPVHRVRWNLLSAEREAQVAQAARDAAREREYYKQREKERAYWRRQEARRQAEAWQRLQSREQARDVIYTTAEKTRRRWRQQGKLPHIVDCSLAEADPPWQWSWAPKGGFVPFSEMHVTWNTTDWSRRHGRPHA